MTTLLASGYNPDTLVVDPAGAETLDLMRTPGSEAFFVWGSPGQFAPSVWGLNRRVGKTGCGTAVVDSQAFGRLYASPIELRAFEANGGLSNTQNYRLELNAGFAVERTTAAVRIAAS